MSTKMEEADHLLQVAEALFEKPAFSPKKRSKKQKKHKKTQILQNQNAKKAKKTLLVFSGSLWGRGSSFLGGYTFASPYFGPFFGNRF